MFSCCVFQSLIEGQGGSGPTLAASARAHARGAAAPTPESRPKPNKGELEACTQPQEPDPWRTLPVLAVPPRHMQDWTQIDELNEEKRLALQEVWDPEGALPLAMEALHLLRATLLRPTAILPRRWCGPWWITCPTCRSLSKDLHALERREQEVDAFCETVATVVNAAPLTSSTLETNCRR